MSNVDLTDLNKSVDLLDLDHQQSHQPTEGDQSNQAGDNILLVSTSVNDSTANESGYLADNTNDVTAPDFHHVRGNDMSNEDSCRDEVAEGDERSNETNDSDGDIGNVRARNGIRMRLSASTPAAMENSIFSQSLLSEIELENITKTQKGNPMLLIRDNGTLRGLSIVGGGISKKGKISWTCFQRGCKGTLKTQIKDTTNLLTQIKVGNRNRTILQENASLKIDNLSKLEQTPHTCDTKMEERKVLSRIGQEVEKIVAELPQDPVRRPQRSAIRERAIATVFQELDTESLKRKRMNLPSSTIPRKVSRAIRAKYPKPQEEITTENKAQYEFSDEIKNGNFILDLDLANSTQNDLLLFYNKDLLQYLTTGDHTLIADGSGSKLNKYI